MTEYEQMLPATGFRVRACMCMAPTRGERRKHAFMCVRVCVRVACMCSPATCTSRLGPYVYTAECKRRVTRLTNGTNGADPMASCEASNFKSASVRSDALIAIKGPSIGCR